MTRTNAVVIALATELPHGCRSRSWRPGTKMQLTVRDVRRTRPAGKRYRLLERLGLSRASQEKTTESRRNQPTL